MSFSKDFVWGVASASYQIEGAAREDGKGLSVWDVFCQREGTVFHGHTGDIACDHYHRYKEDVGLMKQLGVKAYRFSLSWPRIIPEGQGAVNPKGIDFYNRLIDELLSAGITPWITLFHWDYPYELYLKGGWLNADSSDWYADYTRVVCDALSDRVDHWITLNEPQVFVGIGHRTGRHAPGLKLPLFDVVRAAHNVLLSHGKSVDVIRSSSKHKDPKVAIAPSSQPKIPLTDSEKDITAAKTAFWAVTDEVYNSYRWWMDPVFKGLYPEEGLEKLGADAPPIQDGDMEQICRPLDYFATNAYCGKLIRAGDDGLPLEVLPPPGYNQTTQSGWHVTPPTLYWISKWVHERYKKPIVFTENGHQNTDLIALDGKCHDPQRIDYINRYLLELEKAVDEGIPVAGYFYWTIMDNFEWALGYQTRVGLVYTDYQSLERIPKDSYWFYQKIIETNGGALHDFEKND